MNEKRRRQEGSSREQHHSTKKYSKNTKEHIEQIRKNTIGRQPTCVVAAAIDCQLCLEGGRRLTLTLTLTLGLGLG